MLQYVNSRRFQVIALVAAAALALAACSAAAREQAPAPAKTVDMARLFTGRWLEIARLPVVFAKDCVAATTTYSTDDHGRIMVTEACHAHTPSGSLKSITSPGKILDPGANTKLRVSYAPFFSWDFWILDHADDYSWYISGDPAHERLFLFTRAEPDAAERAALVERMRTMGYDVTRLEFPEVK